MSTGENFLKGYMFAFLFKESFVVFFKLNCQEMAQVNYFISLSCLVWSASGLHAWLY